MKRVLTHPFQSLAVSAAAFLFLTAAISPNVVTRSNAGASLRAALSSYGIVYGDPNAGVQSTAPLTDGQLLVGQTSAAPAPTSITGVIGITAGGVTSLSASAPVHLVRGVVTANVASLSAFTVASNDGLTYAAGDRVLLAGQTAKAQNGPYVVGTVASTTAPLTRPTDFATGATTRGGVVFEVSEGALFAQSTWKITTAGAITVGTTAFDEYPRSVTRTVTLVAGAATISNIPLFSQTKSNLVIMRSNPNTCTLTTGGYQADTFMTGTVGTASIIINATVAAGTINTADTSGLNVTVVNW